MSDFGGFRPCGDTDSDIRAYCPCGRPPLGVYQYMEMAMKSLLALGLSTVLCLALPAFGGTGTGAIEGLIVDAATNAPLRNAVMTLTGPLAATYLGMLDRPSSTPSFRTETDQNGRFAFSGLEAGNYEVRATKAGYAFSGWSHKTRATELVAVAAGRPVKDLVVKLEAASVLAGTVRDPAGEPVQDAIVEVLRRSYSGSRKSHLVACPGSASTNDRGEYRIAAVPSGSYLLRVTPLGSAKGFPQMYFPSTTDYAAAEYFTIGSRETRRIDFTLRKGAVARIRGRLIAPDGKTLGGVMVGLSPRKDGPADSVQAGTLASEFQGSFEIAGVTPGSYILSGADKDQKFAAIQ